MYYDTHTHTSFSFDSNAAPEAQIARALELGLSGICFTDHMDFITPRADTAISPDGHTILSGQHYIIDTDEYFRCLMTLKQRYDGRIRVGIGLELGCQAEMAEALSETVKKHPFDFIIGSTHFAEDMDPFYAEYFSGRSNEEGYRAFFSRILENLRAFRDFDALGHLDYATRYGIDGNGSYNWTNYKDIFEEIFRILIKHDICLEVNTAGYKKGLNRPNPGADVLSFYRDCGGKLITLGSDAHNPENIAYAFDKACELLKETGFDEYTVFYDRKPEFYPL